MNAADYRPLDMDVEALARLMGRCQDEHRALKAVLELTYRCNFRCPHCFVHTAADSAGDRSRELSTEEWKGVLDQLADGGGLVVTLTGGEIFCRSDLREIALHARDRRFAIRLFTNASFVDERNADLLAEIGPIQVETTLYGATPETYRAVAGHETYLERALAGVDRMVARGLRVRVKGTLMRENAADMDAMVELARLRWGIDLQLSVHMVQRDDRSDGPVRRQIGAGELDRYLRTHAPKAMRLDRDRDAAPCNVAKDYLVVSPYGDVFPCVNIKRSVGNVRERPLAEIWDTSPYLAYLRRIKISDYETYYTEEEMRYATLCPGAVFRETGNPVGRTAWNRFLHQGRAACGALEPEGCGA